MGFFKKLLKHDPLGKKVLGAAKKVDPLAKKLSGGSRSSGTKKPMGSLIAEAVAKKRTGGVASPIVKPSAPARKMSALAKPVRRGKFNY